MILLVDSACRFWLSILLVVQFGAQSREYVLRAAAAAAGPVAGPAPAPAEPMVLSKAEQRRHDAMAEILERNKRMETEIAEEKVQTVSCANRLYLE